MMARLSSKPSHTCPNHPPLRITRSQEIARPVCHSRADRPEAPHRGDAEAKNRSIRLNRGEDDTSGGAAAFESLTRRPTRTSMTDAPTRAETGLGQDRIGTRMESGDEDGFDADGSG